MALYQVWQTPDRDSPDTVEWHDASSLATQLGVILRMDGARGTDDADVQRITGEPLLRARRWHKIYERMGLVYQDAAANTALTDTGRYLLTLNSMLRTSNRREVAAAVIPTLSKFQLKNPADESWENHYPDDADLHPYWAIWKALAELEHRLHWDELNRELMRVLRHRDLEDAIARIKAAREAVDYNPTTGGSGNAPLRARAHTLEAVAEGRDVDGQLRDQRMTPWFRRAGFGKLLFVSPGEQGTRDGYWRTAPDMIDLINEVARFIPVYRAFSDGPSWSTYYGSMSPWPAPVVQSAAPGGQALEVLRVLLARQNVIAYGPPGTGKTTVALELAQQWEAQNGASSVYRTTFHPNFTYEDFVQGFRPKPEGGFSLQDGVFLKACEGARAMRPPQRVLLLIDEINRGDTARIFGEVLTYIEPDKRSITFSLSQDPLRDFSVPANLYVLGTMNTADRSISLLDLAFRRRFAFISFQPTTALFQSDRFFSSIGGIDLATLLNRINRRLVDNGIDTERQLGQGVLLIPAETSDALLAFRDRVSFELIPTVAEYCYPNLSKTRTILGSLVNPNGTPATLDADEFIAAVMGIT